MNLLMEKEIYKNHIQEYEELFNLINEIFFLLIIRYYDIKTQKIVFYSFDDPINYLLLTEYDIITEITNQKSKKMD